MAAVGAEVTGSWFLSSGLVGFFVVLLLFVFLTALCSDCGRRSFKLRDSEANKDPSSLIRVVKLEEARENPMISEIQRDEKELHPEEENVTITPWRSHLGAPQTDTESHPEEETTITFTPWRSHLVEPQSEDLSTSSPPDSAHISHTVGGGRASDDPSSTPANQEPAQQSSSGDGEHDPRSTGTDLNDRNSLYARVSKKLSVNTSPDQTAEGRRGEGEGAESSPAPPHGKAETEG